MNGFSERDAVFLAEMGLSPLWQLRDAPAAEAEAEAEAGPAALVADAGAPDAVQAQAPAATSAPAQAQANAPAPASAPAHAPAQPHASAPTSAPASAPAPARGPSPLQRVAQSASALEPVPQAPAPTDAAWDDAALPRDATPEEIAAMDWDQLQLAIAACRRCSACRDGRAPVPGSGAKRARWLVAAGASTAQDEKARVPLAGDPGKLLDNMLAAVGMARTRDVYVTNLIKCRPTTAGGADRAPTPDEAAACRPYLEREAVLTGAATVLTLGQIAANTLLGRPLAEPLAGARGQAHAMRAGQQDLRLVATLHPGELLRRGPDKALAWADLCRARAHEAGHEAGRNAGHNAGHDSDGAAAAGHGGAGPV